MKDKSGKVIYTFDDGSLKSLQSSEKLQSRFQLVFFDSVNRVADILPKTVTEVANSKKYQIK